ncbi:MAG TPA: MFS transporter [Jiangellaceae bacterium]|nr:MFS transporter [Jiangellaceae bacterium]
MIGGDTKKWIALALLCVVQFMVVLDIAIVNVALPSIQRDLGFSQADLQWVISAYALVFGGFLLLGGRAADLFGRRRTFLVGLALFSIGSLLCGLAWDDWVLVGSRGVQGLGAAMVSPAALSILITTFTEGGERNTALGVWGAIGGLGAVGGVLLGGMLTDALSWEWVFFVNVPVGVIALALAPALLTESRDRRTRGFDLPGALLVTSGLVVLVYAITNAQSLGWASGETIGLFVGAAVLLTAFVVQETRTSSPIVSFSIFRVQTVTGANVAGLILSAALFSQFLMTTLYMQQVLGYSPMRTGVAYLAVAGTSVIWANVSALLVTRVGVRPVLATGMASLVAGNLHLTQISVGGSYLGDLLPGFLLIGLGIGFSFVPISIAALAGVRAADAGLAAGLINTSQQIGGAVGIATLATIAASSTRDSLAAGASEAAALTEGFISAFWGAAAAAAAGLAVALLLIRRQIPEVAAEPVTELV